MKTGQATSSKEEIVAELFRLFRCGGYEGVSVGDISKATGLGKSSLYHHFPGGKSDMAAAVVAFARDWIGTHILAPLEDEGRPLDARVDAMLDAARQLYGGGTSPCLVASMMVTADGKPADDKVGKILGDWIAAISSALQQNGIGKQKADTRATNALISIEGALLIARATGRIEVFESALEETRDSLLAP
ncbi:MAG: TetR/AcrR family transcriptional regulator [Rhodospirillales bacterium]|nr:TetR/AcrR family transcriptional regulator [Rhodospirillales bacterium]